MIYLVTGKPGTGKSYFCVRKALESLEAGKYLATNVELHDGWPHELARANIFRRYRPSKIAQRAEQFAARTWVTHDLDELTRLRVPGCGKCRNCKSHGRGCMTEGRGVMLLDEAHNWLNARTWDQDETGGTVSKAEAVQNRLKIVRFFSQHRKLGWTIYLVSQDEAQLDAQVRRNFEYHVHLKNLRRVKVPLIGLPLFPINVFVALTTWHDSEQTRVGTNSYLLNKRIANLYDTTATSHGLAYHASDAIWMDRPQPPPENAERQPCEREAPPAPPAPGEPPPLRLIPAGGLSASLTAVTGSNLSQSDDGA